MDLFQHHQQHLSEAEAPLAARMRPRSLEEFVGQSSIVGPGRLLRRAIQADQLSSLIFYGPPGTGKTTLAQIIANTTQAYFIAINAVLAGVKDIRAAVDTAQTRRGHYGQKTILFVDEVHRFSKSQQDALLPWVENGTIILIGATTENPYFEVNQALVSRSRLFQLKPLQASDLKQILHHALTETSRGYGHKSVHLSEAATDHLVNIANGDARTLLNALELAVETTPANEAGVIEIDLSIAEASIQRRAILYDKEGDAHFDTISAFIKSLRGSDPDAACYWLARMIYGGEDPKFIFRRMIIAASEDIGLADPQAVGVVVACAQAFDRVGLPEGQYPLAQAALYLATAPKSNSVLGYFDALAAIENEREAEVPSPLKDGNRDRQGWGHGAGYRYPHAYRDHWVAQQYLPAALQGRVFYQPSHQGHEAQIRDQILSHREAQIAAMIEGNDLGPSEMISVGPESRSQERWLERTISQSGSQLAALRDRLLAMTHLQRHHVVLDLLANSGLMLWECLRQTPEGGVYGRVTTDQALQGIQQQAEALPEIQRPILIASALDQLCPRLLALAPGIQFDRIFGRNLLSHLRDLTGTPAAVAQVLSVFLGSTGEAILVELIPRQSQRIYDLLSPQHLSPKLYRAWQVAEDSFYEPAGDPRLNWEASQLVTLLEAAGLSVEFQLLSETRQWLLSPLVLDRWFSPAEARPSYGDRLRQCLSQRQVDQIRQGLELECLNQTIQWRSTSALLKVVWNHGSSQPTGIANC
ncbi:AAA family ATPase [Lyngbya confervoides]|uniref:Replication-associated recombination protein A n=1 Tax=Lyngbya confervoides BDU141951 TaxID=1574623 RepID=A0ABD4T353_9CYAN|nr:AAA family ATPase [Lyngbya confervoides]MCM1982826.1 AAA family ATPase [Lyngbya confervoides BDU141951]